MGRTKKGDVGSKNNEIIGAYGQDALNYNGDHVCDWFALFKCYLLQESTPQQQQQQQQHDNNKNNHATLADLFHRNTLHRLRQLGLYTNTDTPSTAHQLDAKAVIADVVYTMINTQPRFSGGEESDRVVSTFKEAMSLPQVARWKPASDKTIASLEHHGVLNLAPITSVPSGQKVVGARWVFKIKADSTYRVDSWCRTFCRTLALTAVTPSLPCAGSKASARCSQSWWTWTTRFTCWTCRRHSSTPTPNRTRSSRWRPVTRPTTKQEFLSS